MKLSTQSPRVATRTLAMVLFLGITSLALSAPTYGQGRSQTKAPATSIPQKDDMSPEKMAQMMDVFGPMLGGMVQNMLKASLSYLSTPEAAEMMATFTKNYYEALVRKGFSKEDALKIVMAHGVPAVPSTK